MTRSRVAVIECRTYDEDAVEAAVARGLDLLGGASRFARSGERLMLKPNFLVASAAESAVTTHPAVFRAVVRALRGNGARLSYGDSPGIGSAAGAARRSGVAVPAEVEEIELVEFKTGRQVQYPEGNLVKQFTVADAVLDADGLITLPKMKTHGLTRMTGAVKNQLGCVPGFMKGQWHACMPDVTHFSQMLVDLNRLLQPRLTVMDAVVAMEGNGPRSGDPREVGAIIVSEDPVAVDATACRLMNLDPSLVLTVTFGEAWGLGSATDIEYVGDSFDHLIVEDFVANRSPASTTGSQGTFGRLMKDFVVAKPVIREELCTSCGTCVDVCPVEPRAVAYVSEEARIAEAPPVYDYAACIRCYCCQEMCPERAIDIETPLLGRLTGRRSSGA